MDQFLRRFAEVVETRQHDLATADPVQEYTYEQLDAATDRLAQALYDSRTGENDVCIFLGDPSVDRLTAYLACIKAGCAMLRVDPEAPRQVIRDLMEVCEASRVIAQPAYLEQARDLHPLEPVIVPQDFPVRAAIKPFVRPACDPDSWVAIQTTSGSTGRPKCVPITRTEMDVRIWRKTQYEPPIEHRRRIAFYTNLRLFQELLALHNADIIDCFDLRRHGTAAAVQFIRDRRITAITGQLSLFRQLIQAASVPFPDVNYVAVVGEAVLRSDLENFERYFLPGSRFVARFGGTEHCDLSLAEHRHGDPVPFDVMPMGHFLFPQEITLQAEDGSEAEPGQPGEIVVTADFLPSGYIKDPDKTAAVFKTDPVTAKRSYHAGFYVYRDFEGVVHAFGRKDEMVKVRGYNVRPSEVEQMAQTHPGVLHAAVKPFDGPKGIRQLACFFTATEQGPPSPQELRAFMASQAPGYFVPSIFRAIEALPFAVNGKVMKSELPDPFSLVSGENKPAEFITETERRVAEIWRQNLGHADFGAEDDFFDTGGDSFQAMAMLVDIEHSFGIRLPLEGLIVDGATVAAIARKLEARDGDGDAGRAIPMHRGKDFPPLFATHVIGGHLSDYLELAHRMQPGQALIGLHPKGLDSAHRPAATMPALAADAIAAMRSHTPEGPYRLLGYSFGALVAYAMAEQLLQEGGQISHLILLDPPTLKTGLMRFAKSVYRPVKSGDLRQSARRLTQTVPAALGLREASGQIDEAHRTAALRYQPAPISVPNALIVTATMNPHSQSFREEWMHLLSGQAEIAEIDALHETLVRQPAVWGLAQSVQAFLGDR